MNVGFCRPLQFVGWLRKRSGAIWACSCVRVLSYMASEGVARSPSRVAHSTVPKWLHDPETHANLQVGGLIVLWYGLSLLLSFYNKLLVGEKQGKFPAPLFMTSLQFACQAVIAKTVLALYPPEGYSKRSMSWNDYLKLVLPNGIITGCDIAFSNKSLVYISLAFYTMVKSSSPAFLLLFAFIWGLERPSWSLAGVMAVICTGELLLVWKEADFHVVGFLLVLSASCLAGLRFTITQVLLHGPNKGEAAHGSPLEVIEMLTPIMSVSVFFLSLFMERLGQAFTTSAYFDSPSHVLLTLLLISIGAIIAFLMVWAEYQVIHKTSSLTFMIAGVCKEIVTVVAAVIALGDPFGLENAFGLGIVIFGVVLFNMYKYKKMKAREVRLNHRSSSSRKEAHVVAMKPLDGRQEPESEAAEDEEELLETEEYVPLIPLMSGAVVHRMA